MNARRLGSLHVRLAAVAIFLGLSLPACSSDPDEGAARSSAAIVGGTQTTGARFPATGALVQPADGGLLCTATWIAPRAVLTAAHCLSGVGRGFPAFTLSPELGPQAPTHAGVAVYIDPEFDPHANGPLHDVALMELSEAPEAGGGAAPAEILTDTADGGDLAVGTNLVLVGYGFEQADGGASGARNAGSAAVTQVGAVEMTAGTSGDAEACFGDSGGPAYVAGPDGTPRVAGVISRAADPMNPCAFGSVLTRVDSVSAWIASTLQTIGEHEQPAKAAAGCAAAPWRRSGWGPGVLCALIVFRRRSLARG
jgi:Trypsin